MAEQGEYKGLVWESKEELAFLYWAFELQDRGYIRLIDRARSFNLSDPVINKYPVQIKTKVNTKEQRLLQEHLYTPEFVMLWNENAMGLFIMCLRNHEKFDDKLILCHGYDNIRSYIEIKPSSFDYNNMTRAFRINQKWMWQKWKLYINLIKPKELFERTFTPKEYLLTEKTKKERKINWPVRSLDEYLSLKTNI